MSISLVIRIALALLYLIYVGLFLRAYNPQDPMSGAMVVSSRSPSSTPAASLVS